MIILVSCGIPTPSVDVIQTAIAQTQVAQPTATPPLISEEFLNQMMGFVEEGDKFTALSETGITYTELRQQYASLLGSYKLLESLWPSGQEKEAADEFNKAFEGWELVLDLWNFKIEKYDNPVEPNVNRYLDFINYDTNHQLLIDTHEDSFMVEDYRGRKYLPFDENISLLLTIAQHHFDLGKTIILRQIQ